MAHKVESGGKTYNVTGANSQAEAEQAVSDAEYKADMAKVLWCVIMGLFGAADFYITTFALLIPVNALLHNFFNLNFLLRLAIPLVPAFFGFKMFLKCAWNSGIKNYLFMAIFSLVVATIPLPIFFKNLESSVKFSYEVTSDSVVVYAKAGETDPLPLPKGSIVAPWSGTLKNDGYTQVVITYYNGKADDKLVLDTRPGNWISSKDFEKFSHIDVVSLASDPLYDKPEGKILIAEVPRLQFSGYTRNFKVLEKQEAWQKVALVNKAESFQPVRDFYWVRVNVSDKMATIAVVRKDGDRMMQKAKFGSDDVGDPIPAGTRLRITGKIKSKKFVPVEYNGVKGWLLRNGGVYLTTGDAD